MLDSSIWSEFFLLIFGQYLTSYRCLLLIKSHILRMEKYEDNRRFGMISSSFREDLVLLPRGSESRGRSLSCSQGLSRLRSGLPSFRQAGSVSGPPCSGEGTSESWLSSADASWGPSLLTGLHLRSPPRPLCAPGPQSLPSPGFSASLLHTQMPQKGERRQVWVLTVGLPCLLDVQHQFLLPC